MKILRIIADSDPRSGGPIEGTRRFGAVWARNGHQQDLLTLDPPGTNFLADYPGKIIALGPRYSRNPLHKYRYAPKMVPWLRAHVHEYDAVLVSGLWRYVAMGARFGLANTNTPYFVIPHGMLDPWFRKTYPLKHWAKQVSWLVSEGPLIASARNMLFTSREEMILAENAFWPYKSKGHVINYGTQDISGDAKKQEELFRNIIPGLRDRDYLLFLSRVHPKKGCDILIDAFTSVAKDYPDLDLVIAGPDQVGLVDGLREQVRKAGFKDRIHFPGMLKGDVKFGAFHGAKAFILPSHQENFGIVVAEAMACSTPVLISNKVNIWREIQHDGAGIIGTDNLDGTKSIIKEFLSLDEAAINAMRKRARYSFLQRFHVEKAAMDLIEFIKQRI